MKKSCIRSTQTSLKDPEVRQNYCQKHSKALEHYCTECSKLICLKCTILYNEKCKFHTSIVPRKKKDEEFKEELISKTPIIKEMLHRLSSTAVSVKDCLKSVDGEKQLNSQTTYNRLSEIQQHYSKLQFHVKDKENKFISVLKKFKEKERLSLSDIQKALLQSIGITTLALSAFAKFQNRNNLENVSLEGVYKLAKEVIEIPWYLNKSVSNKGVTPCGVVINENILQLLKNCIKLNNEPNVIYQLLATKDIDEPVEILYVPIKNLHSLIQNDENKSRDKKKKASKLAINLNFKNVEEGSKLKPFYIGAKESVVVSFIKTPMDFFVQRFVQRDLLQKVITQLENVDCSPELFIRDIKKDILYAVYNEFDENWYRCRVGNLKKMGHKYVYTTFCIDYGYTVPASVDRIRQLPPSLQSVPPLATNCSIFFETRLLWSPTMKTLMKKTIANKSLTLLVRRVSCSPYGFTDKYDCDLTVDNKVDVGKVLISHQCNLKSSLLNYEDKEKTNVPNYKNNNEAMSSEDDGHNNYFRKSVYSNSVLLNRFLAKKREKKRTVTRVALSTPEHDSAAYNGREDLHGNSKAKTSSFNGKYETYNKQRYPGSQSMSTNYMGHYPKEEQGQELSSNHSYPQQQQDTGTFQTFVQNHQDLIKPFLHKTAHGKGELLTHYVPTALKSRVNNDVTTLRNLRK